MWNVRYCLLSLFFFSLQCAEPDTVEPEQASGEVVDLSPFANPSSETSSETFPTPCTPGSCDDGSPCTTDTCMNGYCVFEAQVGEACDDGSICTTDDVCTGSGQCDGGTPIVCEASDVPCTTTVCDPVAGCAYIPAPDGAPCTDGNKCTGSGECASGECVSIPLDCGESDAPCVTSMACNELTGQCDEVPAPNGTACDDGDMCSEADVCIEENAWAQHRWIAMTGTTAR